MSRALSITAALITMYFVAPSVFASDPVSTTTSPQRPNVLWILAEDLSPFMGCYDDPINTGHTPTIDKLASTLAPQRATNWARMVGKVIEEATLDQSQKTLGSNAQTNRSLGLVKFKSWEAKRTRGTYAREKN